jgi:hypothetical protein
MTAETTPRSTEPKRPRLRFHLSTLVVLVVLAGALLGPHLMPFHFEAQGPGDVAEVTSYGFPFSFYQSHRHGTKGGGSGSEGMTVNPLAAPINFFIVLMPVLVFSERLIRLRAGEARSDKPIWIPIAAGILTCILGALILKANLGPGEAPASSGGTPPDAPPSSWRSVLVLERGWPVTAYRLITGDLIENTATIWINERVSRTERLDERVRDSNTAYRITLENAQAQYSGLEILLNLIASVFILGSAYLAAEFLLSRAARRWTPRHESPTASP